VKVRGFKVQLNKEADRTILHSSLEKFTNFNLDSFWNRATDSAKYWCTN